MFSVQFLNLLFHDADDQVPSVPVREIGGKTQAGKICCGLNVDCV